MTFKTIFNSFNNKMKFILVGGIIWNFKVLTNIKKKQVKIASMKEMAKYFHKALFKDLKAQKQTELVLKMAKSKCT